MGGERETGEFWRMIEKTATSDPALTRWKPFTSRGKSWPPPLYQNNISQASYGPVAFEFHGALFN